MTLAENIVTAFQNRAQSKNWAAWVNQNPVMANVLAEAELLCQ